jgi:hypothetical protein
MLPSRGRDLNIRNFLGLIVLHKNLYFININMNIDTLFYSHKCCPITHHASLKGERSSSSFLTLALEEGMVSVTPWSYFTPGTHWIGGWVDLRAGVDPETRGKILCLCRGLNSGQPVCSHTLYPAPSFYIIRVFLLGGWGLRKNMMQYWHEW